MAVVTKNINILVEKRFPTYYPLGVPTQENNISQIYFLQLRFYDFIINAKKLDFLRYLPVLTTLLKRE